jgi:hypothetical protein
MPSAAVPKEAVSRISGGDKVKPADPLDMAVARAFQRDEAPRRDPVADRMFAKCFGGEVLCLITRDVAETIYGFDQEALEQSWQRLSEHRRQPYYDIADAVIAKLKAVGVMR